MKDLRARRKAAGKAKIQKNQVAARAKLINKFGA